MKPEIIVIGGSAGSLEVILPVVEALPPGTRATIVIIVHRKADPDSLLVGLLSERTTLPVKEVEDKEPIQPGAIYIAPADYHLLVEDAHSFSLDSSEKVHFCRPSIDATFESVAAVFGNRAAGVLLSGANADGAEGLKRIGAGGGRTLTQDPATAGVGFMPQQAINLNAAQTVVAAADLPQVIRSLLTDD